MTPPIDHAPGAPAAPPRRRILLGEVVGRAFAIGGVVGVLFLVGGVMFVVRGSNSSCTGNDCNLGTAYGLVLLPFVAWVLVAIVAAISGVVLALWRGESGRRLAAIGVVLAVSIGPFIALFVVLAVASI